MLRWRRGQKRPRSADVEELVDETPAFLLGKSPEIFWRRGERVPPWAWLNPLTHQEPSAVRAFARSAPATGYPGELLALAVARVQPHQTSRHQD